MSLNEAISLNETLITIQLKSKRLLRSTLLAITQCFMKLLIRKKIGTGNSLPRMFPPFMGP